MSQYHDIEVPAPQQVRWGPVDQRPPGILVEDPLGQAFIPWAELEIEIEMKLLPQVRVVPVGSRAEVGDLGDRKNWIVRIVDPEGRELGYIWFGSNPEAKWQWDGLVRLGNPEASVDKAVWQSFQRFSDGSYRRVEAKLVV
jgi:hypothetical protein